MGADAVWAEQKCRQGRRRKAAMNEQGPWQIARSFTQPARFDRITAATDQSSNGIRRERSLHRHTFSQIAWLVHIQTPMGCDVVAQQLHGHHRQQRADPLADLRHR